MDVRPLFLTLFLTAALPACGNPTLVGAVLDSNGRPVEGARIELVRSLAGPPCAEESVLYRSTTGQDGRFGLSSLPPGCFDLRIEGDGFAPLERTSVEIPAGAGLRDLGRFVVERGTVLAGRVVDSYGQSVAGAEIRAVSQASRDGIADGKVRPTAVSGPHGYFTLVDLPREGRIGLDVCCEGFLTGSWTLPEPSLEPLHLVLEPAVRIAGRVSDPTGALVAGAQIRVWLSGEDPNEPVSTRPCRYIDTTAETDAEGRFVLESLPPGWWTVQAEASGWLSTETECQQVLAGASLEGIEIVLGPAEPASR
jgi:protocatechuate 3,4-dioxygenase beta subunit